MENSTESVTGIGPTFRNVTMRRGERFDLRTTYNELSEKQQKTTPPKGRDGWSFK
jgi:hypothetical protein